MGPPNIFLNIAISKISRELSLFFLYRALNSSLTGI